MGSLQGHKSSCLFLGISTSLHLICENQAINVFMWSNTLAPGLPTMKRAPKEISVSGQEIFGSKCLIAVSQHLPKRAPNA